MRIRDKTIYELAQDANEAIKDLGWQIFYEFEPFLERIADGLLWVTEKWVGIVAKIRSFWLAREIEAELNRERIRGIISEDLDEPWEETNGED